MALPTINKPLIFSKVLNQIEKKRQAFDTLGASILESHHCADERRVSRRPLKYDSRPAETRQYHDVEP